MTQKIWVFNSHGPKRSRVVKKRILNKKMMKKLVVSVLSFSMVLGLSGSVFGASHAANGSNVIPSKSTWKSFSICTREDGGSWEDSLKKVYRTNTDGTYFLDENGKKVTFVKGVDYATEGWINGTPGLKNNSQEVTFYCKATGWDGEYGSMTRNGPSVLVADNPWGMTLTMTGIPVEFGRYYTMDFDISGNLKLADYNQNTHQTTYVPADKHVLLKAFDYNSNGEPSAGFENVKQVEIVKDKETGEITISENEVSKDGYITVFNPEVYKEDGVDQNFTSHVTATFKIPDSPDDWGGGKHSGIFTQMGIKFALGANLVAYPDEGSMKGNIHIENMKMTAGKQYTVKYYDGNKHKSTRYVNDEDSATSVSLKKSRSTLSGYTDIATGKKFNFSTILTKNMNLRAIWTKTPAPNKTNITSVKGKKKKREVVTFGTNKNTKGYQVMYSYSNKFKKKSKFKTRTKYTTNTSEYTVKSLKSGKIVYVKARAYNLDSTGQKIYGAWSSTQVAYVR